MIESFEKPYSPKEVEEKIYKKWEESGLFNPDNLPQTATDITPTASESPQLSALGPHKSAFCICLPPPNVTGTLHMGHALNATIQDILIRKKRMEGYKALWIPGTDHAGIATQNAVEKQLKKEGLSRHDLGKEKFLEKVWEWKEKYGNIILDQLKKLGASCDWSRTAFTMDPKYAKAVEFAFNHYYKKGWIYQGEKIVNWCPRCGTSLSDLELEYAEEKGKLWYIKYLLTQTVSDTTPTASESPQLSALSPHKSAFIVVATTRPETMLGDSAVAVNSKDERYKDFIGKTAILPIQNREIPIIADEAVEKEFGTGAVKVTPAHDFADAEIGERHNLKIIKVINEKGRMTDEAGEICVGLKIAECREKVLEKLKELNLLEKEEDYNHSVAKCYRCNGTVEPLPSLQWFLKMDELAKLAIKAVESGKVKFHPDRWEKVYLDWLKNIKDWCISRQIWWGHKIPAAKCLSCEEIIISPTIKEKWFVVRHGETDWNIEGRWQGHSETPLNDTGRAQTKEATQKLKNKNIDIIISSDLSRCKETAEIIAKELNLTPIFDKRLRERHGGIAQGLTHEEHEEKFGKEVAEAWRTYTGKPEGGESWQELENRVLEALKEHRVKHAGKNVAVITHGGPVQMILKSVRNISLEEARIYLPKNTEIIELTIADKKCKCGSDFIEPSNDVLDTWFSSALWPFATLGWPANCEGEGKSKKENGKCEPKKESDLEQFYPTQVLSTARDIINLWVARMVYSGMEFIKEAPFSEVIIHATILTKDGKRMSKSLGTGIDPMDLIEKYGADATRFGLIWQSMGGQDIHWAEEHVMAGKKFCNKLWNISRFVLSKTNLWKSDFHSGKSDFPKIENYPESKEILEKLEATKKSVKNDIENYEFGQALHTLYDFIWHDFADKYIEYSKNKDSVEVLSTLSLTLSTILKLLHPFMPFITEEIYQHMFTLQSPNKKRKDMAEFLMIEKW